MDNSQPASVLIGVDLATGKDRGCFAVIRLPCLPEDEGRRFVSRVFDSREAAEWWVLQQVGQYFGPNDYRIEGPVCTIT